MTPGLRLGLCAALVGLLCFSLMAQYALDANPRVGSSGRNRTQRTGMSMSAPIYTVSRVSGDMVYNRANAFRDPTYNIYQSWVDTGSSYYSSNQRRTDNRAGTVLARGGEPTYATGAVRPASRVAGRATTPRRASPGTGATSLRSPAYSAARPTSARVSSGRTGTTRISNKARR